jgi:ATP-dependent RNA helicase DeaD
METFSELKISEPLSRAISEIGFTKPSPIQAQALPILLGDATDFIGLAATGTGKTAAFSIPLLEKIDPKKRAVQGLILCPTRELSLQVAGQVNLLGKHLGIKALSIYGGAGYGDQFRGLRDGHQIVIGTPGRLIDHLERGSLNLESVSVVILDEADEMISMGFREAMETILGSVQRDSSNIWLFSATMSPSVKRVAENFLIKPEMVQVNKTEMLSSTVQQSYFITAEKNKPEILCKLIDGADDFFGLVFCQTKALVIDLTRYLSENGYAVDCLHGDKSQKDREIAMNRFRERKAKILVCTDVAARGLDVKDVTHVINFSIPRELDNYVHRIGRTARSGKSGFAISLVSPANRYLIKRIEHVTKSRMVEGTLPSRKSLAAKKIGAILNKVNAQTNFKLAVDVMDDAWKEAISGMSTEEVAGRFLSIMFPEVFGEEGRPAMQRADMPSDSERGEESRSGRRDRGDRRGGRRGERSDRPGRGGRERRFNGRERGSRDRRASDRSDRGDAPVAVGGDLDTPSQNSRRERRPRRDNPRRSDRRPEAV